MRAKKLAKLIDEAWFEGSLAGISNHDKDYADVFPIFGEARLAIHGRTKYSYLLLRSHRHGFEVGKEVCMAGLAAMKREIPSEVPAYPEEV